jgi:hypothetical protein
VPCVEYLGKRNPEKFPTPEEYRALLESYPEAMYPSVDALEAAGKAAGYEDPSEIADEPSWVWTKPGEGAATANYVPALRSALPRYKALQVRLQGQFRNTRRCNVLSFLDGQSAQSCRESFALCPVPMPEALSRPSLCFGVYVHNFATRWRLRGRRPWPRRDEAVLPSGSLLP